jgi:hypothetical protein
MAKSIEAGRKSGLTGRFFGQPSRCAQRDSFRSGMRL